MTGGTGDRTGGGALPHARGQPGSPRGTPAHPQPPQTFQLACSPQNAGLVFAHSLEAKKGLRFTSGSTCHCDKGK